MAGEGAPSWWWWRPSASLYWRWFGNAESKAFFLSAYHAVACYILYTQWLKLQSTSSHEWRYWEIGSVTILLNNRIAALVVLICFAVTIVDICIVLEPKTSTTCFPKRNTILLKTHAFHTSLHYMVVSCRRLNGSLIASAAARTTSGTDNRTTTYTALMSASLGWCLARGRDRLVLEAVQRLSGFGSISILN